MSSFLQNLTNLSLRRLYKFILKRLIGRYLIDELLIDQLEVISTDGRVKIHNLVLNCDVLNDEYLNQLPFSLKSVTIDKFEFTVSFTSVMNDGCHFNIDGLTIDIIPNPNQTSGKSKRPSDINHDNESPSESTNNDEDLGAMQFITKWIEVIIARLQVTLTNININVHTGLTNTNYLSVKISELLFYNTHPSLFNGMSSVDVSHSLGTSNYYSTQVLGAKKYFNISDINVSSVQTSSSLPQSILELSNGLRVQLKVDDVNNIDIDINTQDCLLKINETITAPILCSILAVYNTKISAGNIVSNTFDLLNLDTSIPSSTMKTLLWLSKEYDSNSSEVTDDINYSLVLRLMKQYREARGNNLDYRNNVPMTSKYELYNSVHVSDDIDFPSSEDDEIGNIDGDDSTINSDLFHDPTGTKPNTNSKVSFSQSAQYLSQSYYGFCDNTASGGDVKKIVHNTVKKRMVNVIVRSANINIVLSHVSDTGNSESINLMLTNTIMTTNALSNYFDNGNSEMNVQTSISISDVSITESRGDEPQFIVPLLHLSHQSTADSNTVIDAPSIDIGVSYVASTGTDISHNKCSLTVKGELTKSLIFSVYIDRILHWQSIVTSLIERFNSIVSSPDIYEPCSTSVIISIPDISIILHTALNNKFPWSDLLLDMDLNKNSSQWKQLGTADALILSHLKASPAGFLLNAVNVKLNYDYNLLKNSVLQSIETSIFSTDMFLQNSMSIDANSIVYLTSQVGKVYGKYNQSGKVVQPVVVRFYKEIMDEINNMNKSNGNLGKGGVGVDNIVNESGMITPPTVDDGKLLHLQAHKVVSKLTQREYNCLIAISKAISSSDIINQKKTPSKDGIGAVLDADIALITVCKSADYIFNNPNSVKPDEDKLFSFHMSAIKPVIEIYSGDNDAYISIISEDFAMFEDTSSDHDLLGDDAMSSPFLHRTTLHFNRNYDNPGNPEKMNNLLNGAGFFTYAPSISKMKNKSNGIYPHVFSVQILLTDEYLGDSTDSTTVKQSDTMKTMRFHMDFQDVTLRYNPASNWLLQVVDILTPVPIGKNYEVLKLKENKKKYKPPSRSKNSANSPYERTIVSTRIRKGLIDYQCLPLNSRSIISVGMLKMSATIVSNCDAFNLKFTLTDFGYYLSNTISTTYEQSPINRYGKHPGNDDNKSMKAGGSTLLQRYLDYDRFIDECNLIQLITIDNLETLVSFQTSTGVALLLSINIGVCYVYACLDSLTLLANTVNQWWADFCSENVTTSNNLSSSLVTVSDSALSAGSICKEAADINSNEMSIKVLDVSKMKDEEQNITLTDLYNETILQDENTLKIIDDYYGGIRENGDEVWDAQYDYDDDLCDENITSVSVKMVSNAPRDVTSMDDEASGDADKSVTSSTISFTGLEYNFFSAQNQEVFDDADLDSIFDEDDETKPTDSLVATSTFNAASMMLSSLIVGKKIVKEEAIEMDVINHSKQLNSNNESVTLDDGDNDPAQDYVDLDSILANIVDNPPLNIRVDSEEVKIDFQNAYGPDCHRDVEQEAAWYSNVKDSHSVLSDNREEHAQWLGGVNPTIQAFYINPKDENEEEDDSEDRSALENGLVTKTLVTIKGNLRLRLFKGSDWTGDTVNIAVPRSNETKQSASKKLESLLEENTSVNCDGYNSNMAVIQSNYFSNNLFEDQKNLNSKQKKSNKSTREKEDYVDIVLKDIFIRIRQYDSSKFDLVKYDEVYRAGPIETPTPCDAELNGKFPTQRVTIHTKESAVSIALRGARKKKVVHSWVTKSKPKQLNKPFFAVSIVEYLNIHEEVSIPEIYVQLMVSPIRCYLDEHFINFVKAVASSKTTTSIQEQPRVNIIFGRVSINAIEVKIDYLPGYFNLSKLQDGDYLQLLNMFPLEGMELVVKKTYITSGINGIDSLLHIIMEGCINDIYSNQMHKVISGTAPFRGISNIGAGLQDLMLIPMKDYRKTGGVIKELQKGTASLLRTLTREALHASHKITMFVARGLTELTSIADPSLSNATKNNVNRKEKKSSFIQNNQPSTAKIGFEKGLQSLNREVNIAFDTIVALPIKQYERNGAGGYTKAVIRALPIAVLRPIAGVSEALSYTLLGIRNQFDPSFKSDEEGLYKFNKDIDI